MISSLLTILCLVLLAANTLFLSWNLYRSFRAVDYVVNVDEVSDNA